MIIYYQQEIQKLLGNYVLIAHYYLVPDIN